MINNLVPLVLFATSSTLTPGPNNFMIMNSGLQFGLKRSLPHYFGISVGFPLMLLLVALGMGAVFAKFIWLKAVLQIIGSLYMLYLAYQILRSHSQSKTIKSTQPLSFIQALLFQWVNPKAWLMAVSAISIYTLSHNYTVNAILMSVIFFIVCIPGTGVWLLFGKVLQRILKDDSHRVWFNIAMAVGLVASIALIFVD